MRLFLTDSTIELRSRDSGFRLGAGMDNDFVRTPLYESTRCPSAAPNPKPGTLNREAEFT
jgi:hypothetical protein